MEGTKLDLDRNNKNNKIIWIIIAVCIGVVLIGVIGGCIFIDSDDVIKSKLDIVETTMSVEYNSYLGYSAVVKGTAKNNTKKNYSYASVEFSVYDSEGNNLGTAWANINNLSSGDTWLFEASLLSYPSTRPTSFKLVDINAW